MTTTMTTTSSSVGVVALNSPTMKRKQCDCCSALQKMMTFPPCCYSSELQSFVRCCYFFQPLPNLLPTMSSNNENKIKISYNWHSKKYFLWGCLAETCPTPFPPHRNGEQKFSRLMGKIGIFKIKNSIVM